MALIFLHYRLGSCGLVSHALMRHLDIDFVPQPYGHPLIDPVIDICNDPPSLIFGGEVLSEMPAILTYLAVRGGQPGLLGSSARDTAMVMHWLSLLDGKLHNTAFKMMAVPHYFTIDGTAHTCHTAIWARGQALVHEFFFKIDTSLAGVVYAVGNNLTVVDFNLYIFARWYDEMYGLGQLSLHFPEYYRVMRNIERLPAVRQAVHEQYKLPLFP